VELECAPVLQTPKKNVSTIFLAVEHPSSFDGMVSTSNHLVPAEKEVTISTSKPIWWTAELKKLSWD
jgi:hypothetical protein